MHLQIVTLLLFTSLTFGQSSIVASGCTNYTVGEVFPIMQQIKKESVSLGIPKYEVPIVVVKKKPLTWWQKILKMFNFK